MDVWPLLVLSVVLFSAHCAQAVPSAHSLDQFSLLQLPPGQAGPSKAKQEHELKPLVAPGSEDQGLWSAGTGINPRTILDSGGDELVFEALEAPMLPEAAAEQQSDQGESDPLRWLPEWVLQGARRASDAWLSAVKAQQPSVLRLVQLVFVASLLLLTGRCGRCGHEDKLLRCFHSQSSRGGHAAIEGIIEPVCW
mmetsp:Transcript_79628/g.184851  ORF Transcript_79628/g.184851 Transcript_79628/m.184851 type:complete len:195 (-) Transcript_79628:129-713(-)